MRPRIIALPQAGVDVSDEELKHAVLDAALARAASAGVCDDLLAKAAAEAGASGAERRLFPHGIASLLEFHSHQADAEMVRRLEAAKLKELPVRKRIRTAVLTRLEVLQPHKEAARRAALWLALPHNGPLAARLVYDTVDAMWRAAGDVSTDFNFYTKRAILGGVYTATVLRWFADRSPEGQDTSAFLDARIENVMQYEKLKKRVRDIAQPGLDQLCEAVFRKV